MRSSKLLAVLSVPALLAVGCAAGSPDDAASSGSSVTDGAPKLCAAIRGNGHYIVTHFDSLARIIEHYGVVDAVAGGSSGSVSTFLYESVLKNPLVSRCGDAACTPEARAARVALALKSAEGFGAAVASTDDAVAIRDLVQVTARLRQAYEAQGIDGISSSDVRTAAQKLQQVLQIPELQGIVNPEVVAMLRDDAHLAYNVREISTAIKSIGAFSVDDNRLFFRPGILNWDAVATLFGRAGDFYAGYEPADNAAFGAWLDACAPQSVGKSWAETSALPAGESTCGALFGRAVLDYHTKIHGRVEAPRRLAERVGDASSPLHKLLSTSVLEGDAVSAYDAARTVYRSGEVASGSVPFNISFDDVKFGYWGSEADLAKVARNERHFGDLKTTKMTSLGDATWGAVLQTSPAEPGLSRFVALPDGRLSAGGWSDLAPVLVLKNLGCERVVYVTREGDESPFATKIAKNLGMTEADYAGLFDLSQPTSSFSQSISAADGVWCTNWNSFKDFEQREMALDAYTAPLEVRASFAGIATLQPYGRTSERLDKPGCTPGVSGGATYPQ